MLQLRFFGPNVHAAGHGLHFYLHHVLAGRRLDEARHRANHSRQVHHLALRALPARHPQEVLGNSPAAQQLLPCDGGALADPGRIGLLQDAFHAHQHGSQRGVQFMRKSRRQRSHRRQPVRFGQMGLRRPPLGNVAPHLHHLLQAPVGIQDGRSVHLFPYHLPLGRVPFADPHLPRPGCQTRHGRTVGHGAAAGCELAALAA